MLKRIVSVMLVFSLIIPITGCNVQKETKYEASFLNLFDTVTEVVGYASTKDEFKICSQLVYDSLKEYHELYDIYHTYDGVNNIKSINDNAGIKPVKVDQRIIDLLLFAKEAEEISGHKVNIALGSVLSIWHDYRTNGSENPEEASLPPMDHLEEAMEHTDITNLIINEEDSTVYLQDPFMSLDVGSIAKGYATEQVANILVDKGYTSVLLSVGGNVRAIGDKAYQNEPWVVGIQNPDLESEEKNLYTLDLVDLSLVTSGVYQRYYTVDGKGYHHIIDPDTLMPSDYFTSVSIICKNSGMADVLSTTLFNMSLEEGKIFVEKLENTEAVWVLKDGNVVYSSNFQSLIHP